MPADNISRDVPPDQTFKINMVMEIKNLGELDKALLGINEDVFKNHVNSQKNDFALWVRHSIRDNKLADKLDKTISFSETKKLVGQRLEELSKEKESPFAVAVPNAPLLLTSSHLYEIPPPQVLPKKSFQQKQAPSKDYNLDSSPLDSIDSSFEKLFRTESMAKDSDSGKAVFGGKTNTQTDKKAFSASAFKDTKGIPDSRLNINKPDFELDFIDDESLDEPPLPEETKNEDPYANTPYYPWEKEKGSSIGKGTETLGMPKPSKEFSTLSQLDSIRKPDSFGSGSPAYAEAPKQWQAQKNSAETEKKPADIKVSPNMEHDMPLPPPFELHPMQKAKHHILKIVGWILVAVVGVLIIAFVISRYLVA
jgi:hypothetical protein